MTGRRVEARGWGWRHGGRRAWALRGVDLAVEPGEVVLLLGPSGAGKSTLLAGVAGLLDSSEHGTGESEGTLEVGGLDARAARAEAVGRGDGTAATGLLLQDPQAQTVLARCGDDVAFGLENHAVAPQEIWARVDGALSSVGLRGDGASSLGDDVRAHPTARLSGGQRQRLALAGVLALRPGVLLLDEPTAMLDPAAASALRDLVAGLVRETGATALVVEHRVATWQDVADRVVVLEPGGGVVADGPTRDVLRDRGSWLAERGVWVPGLTGAAVTGTAPGRPDGGALLVAQDVSVGRAGLPRPVLTGVDLTLTAGRATALVGPNGAGKSTLALVLGGLARPSSGAVTATAALRGDPAPSSAEPARWSPRDLVRRIGSVFQDPRHQFVAATTADELAVGPRRIGLPDNEIRARVDDLLQRLHLEPLARANPFTLSGGEQRRLSVATALATRPRVVVLDEPTFGQDARTWAGLVELLRELLDDGTAVVAATHDDDLVTAVADDVVSLAAGRAVHV